LADQTIYSLLLATDGTLWVGTNGGLARLAHDRASFEGVDFGFRRSDGRPTGPSVFSLAEDNDGTVWLGTFQQGLLHLDQDGGIIEQYSRDHGDFPSDRINAVCVDSSGVIWAGSPLGLHRLDRGSSSFRNIRRSHGLPTDSVASIVEDADGTLWLGTSNGLVRLNPENDKIVVFTAADGLPSNELNQIAATRTADGILAFGTKRGFVVFDPRSLGPDPTLLGPVLTDVLVFNESVPVVASQINGPMNDGFTLPIAASYLSHLVVGYRESVLSIEFAALDFADPNRNRYRYILEGLDQRWINTDPQHRMATYTNLPAGDYTFRVQAASTSGKWSDREARLDLTVVPAPWKSWWAYTLYGLIFFGVIAWFIYNQRALATFERSRADEEQRINRELRRIDRLKDEFLANTSHELRTPLHGIVGLAESLLDGASGPLPASARNNLGMISSSGHRLASLIDDVLDFTQLRNDSLTLSFKPVDLGALADVVLTLSRPLVGSKELALVNDIPADVPLVLADENRLQQIMHNLVGNAIKFTERGEVTVTAVTLDDRLAVAVEDTGIGIDPADQERIFESFVQAEGDSTRRYGGTGLGLAVSRQLVDLHGGELAVDSVPGEGSTFTFTLALASAEDTVVKPVDAAPSREIPAPIMTAEMETEQQDHQGLGFKVMVVDDEPVIRQVLVNQLALHDYQVAEAVDGPAALQVLEEENPDLVLLDVMMPRMSGFDVCRRIRENVGLGKLPVIYLSAKNQLDDIVTGLDSGGNDYLTKPISKAELLARVRTQIELLESHRDLEQKVLERTAELHQANTELARLARVDGLTGLANRRHFDEELGRQWSNHQRSQHPISLLLCDVDHFKRYNDQYGHQMGDKTLQTVASILAASAQRPFDLVARFGGEEFVLLLPETDANGAVQVAGVVRRRLEAKCITHVASAVAPVVTLSIGVASHVPQKGEDPALLVKMSDRALYQAKEEGRNRAVVAGDDSTLPGAASH
jgi:diguanylate cyclase (GGDEF)-like protein